MPTSSKSRMVYDRLRSGILDGEYAPGHRLVLTVLAQELEVSVVPVREAVRRLQAEGLVTYRHNVGAQVSGVDSAEYRDSMSTLALLEGRATALAAPCLSPDALREAEALNERMRRLTAQDFSSTDYRRLNGRFHTLLTDPCPNARLLCLMRAEAERVNLIRRTALHFSAATSTAFVRQHDQLLALIRDGAPGETIEQEVREHKLASMRVYLGEEAEPRGDGAGDAVALSPAPAGS